MEATKICPSDPQPPSQTLREWLRHHDTCPHDVCRQCRKGEQAATHDDHTFTPFNCDCGLGAALDAQEVSPQPDLARAWQSGHPPPHAKYLVRRDGWVFVATPCYGMHEPWWVPALPNRKEAEPHTMQDGDEWLALDAAYLAACRSPATGALMDGQQWVHCLECNLDFRLAITIPCPLDLYIAALRTAQCPNCGARNNLRVYELGRRPNADSAATILLGARL